MNSVTVSSPPLRGGEKNGDEKRGGKTLMTFRVLCSDCQFLARLHQALPELASRRSRAPEVAAGIKAMRQHCPGFAHWCPAGAPPPMPSTNTQTEPNDRSQTAPDQTAT